MIASFVEDEMEEMFARIDENGDRSISFEEFAGLMRVMDHTSTDAELRVKFAVIDANHDGRISFDEFSGWILR